MKTTTIMNKMATVEEKGRPVEKIKGGMVTMPFIFGKLSSCCLSSFLIIKLSSLNNTKAFVTLITLMILFLQQLTYVRSWLLLALEVTCKAT